MENISIYKYSRLTQSEILNLCKRAESNLSDYFKTVDAIIKNVEENKDKALFEYSIKLDNVKSGLHEFQVSDEEFSRAHDLIDEGMKEALIFCSTNVKKFHEAQMPKKEWMIEMHPGVYAGEKNQAIETVALYVPRGKGSFPSVAMMTSVPAVIAGVETPVIFTPPEEDGSVDCATLVAAEIAGVKTVFKIGGAQAVAAAAFGTVGAAVPIDTSPSPSLLAPVPSGAGGSTGSVLLLAASLALVSFDGRARPLEVSTRIALA